MLIHKLIFQTENYFFFKENPFGKYSKPYNFAVPTELQTKIKPDLERSTSIWNT